MTDTTDLVRRLREAEKSDDGVSPFNFDSVLMKEAADAIERLSAPAPEYKEENVKAEPAPDAMRELLWRVVSGQEVPMAEIHAVLTATAAPAPDAAIDAALYAYLKGEKG